MPMAVFTKVNGKKTFHMTDYSRCYYAYAKDGNRECIVNISEGDLEDLGEMKRGFLR